MSATATLTICRVEPTSADEHTLSAEDARHRVALHAASTLLPASASITMRNQVRTRWFNALKPISGVDPDWTIVYLPGLHYSDNDTYAVHRSTGRVFGGDVREHTIARGESTDQWLARLGALV